MISLFKKNFPGYGFDAFGYPLKYRSAKEAGCATTSIPEHSVFYFDKRLIDSAGGVAIENHGLTSTATGITGEYGCYAEIPADSLPYDVLCDDKPWTLEIKFRCTDTAKWNRPSRVIFGRGDDPSRLDIIVEKDRVLPGSLDELMVYNDFNNTNWHTIKITHTENNVFTLFADGIQSESTTREDKNMRENTIWIGWDGESYSGTNDRFMYPLEIE